MHDELNHAVADERDDPWVVTSIKLRRSTKRAVKIYAAKHGETMQSVLEEALQRILNAESE